MTAKTTAKKPASKTTAKNPIEVIASTISGIDAKTEKRIISAFGEFTKAHDVLTIATKTKSSIAIELFGLLRTDNTSVVMDALFKLGLVPTSVIKVDGKHQPIGRALQDVKKRFIISPLGAYQGTQPTKSSDSKGSDSKGSDSKGSDSKGSDSKGAPKKTTTNNPSNAVVWGAVKDMPLPLVNEAFLENMSILKFKARDYINEARALGKQGLDDIEYLETLIEAMDAVLEFNAKLKL